MAGNENSRNDVGVRRCNFCGKPENRTKSLFSAGDVHICDECVLFCYDILEERHLIDKPVKADSVDSGITLTKPEDIKKELDQYVIGQDEAKLSLSVAVMSNSERDDDDVEIQKANVLLLGPTGVGRPFWLKRLPRP